MSGHSKWSKIKHKKAAEDAKRGKVFSELSKLIRVAAKEGKSGDPNQNPTLRTLLEKAREANMPKENVQRAIDKGLGIGDTGPIEEVVYEGFGPGGVGYMVIAQTDNRQRTGAEVRHMFEKSGGSLGGPGTVTYMFERQGNEIVVKVPIPVDEETRKKAVAMKDNIEGLDDVEEVVINVKE